ncbi:MAG: lysozyme inhibitor LprI family protein [Pseudomonadota bacterium]
MPKGPILIAAALALFATGQDHENWGTAKDEWANDFPESKAICRRLGPPRIPAADRPTPAQRAALKGCDSQALYYGPRADPAKARLCALIEVESEGEDDIGDVFHGRTILMQLYANGLGVEPNPDLATAYACEIDGAPAEINLRVLHMQGLKTSPEINADYCDDITSGLAMGLCTARRSEAAAIGRDARIKALTDRLSPAAASAYAPMKRAFDAYVVARSDGEVDQSGTARGAFIVEEQDRLLDQYLLDLGRLLGGRWPPATAAAAQAADAKLNASYRAALESNAPEGNFTTITPDLIRTTQRAWLAYRDAWLRFAAVAAPGVPRDAVLARLTNLRTAQLDELQATP